MPDLGLLLGASSPGPTYFRFVKGFLQNHAKVLQKTHTFHCFTSETKECGALRRQVSPLSLIAKPVVGRASVGFDGAVVKEQCQ